MNMEVLCGRKIDGKKSIYEIGKELQAVHEGAANTVI